MWGKASSRACVRVGKKHLRRQRRPGDRQVERLDELPCKGWTMRASSSAASKMRVPGRPDGGPRRRNSVESAAIPPGFLDACGDAEDLSLSVHCTEVDERARRLSDFSDLAMFLPGFEPLCTGIASEDLARVAAEGFIVEVLELADFVVAEWIARHRRHEDTSRGARPTRPTG
jgi:hypothetical protein